MTYDCDVSIVIRTYNEARLIGELLSVIFRQTTKKKFEVIIVDSESTDDTVKIAKQFPVKVVGIRKSEFTYGKSLNVGIENSQGQYIVAVSGHCVPANTDWLEEILKPIENNESVGMCYGRQEGVNRRYLGYPSTRFSERVLFKKQYPEERDKAPCSPFLNNANAAFKRDVWRQIRFDEELPGLEDLDFAIKAQKHFNLSSLYVPNARVLHIHDENNGHIFRRFLREERAFIKIHSIACPRQTMFTISKSLLKDLFTDFRTASSQKNGLRRFTRTILGFRLAQYFAIYWAYHEPIENRSKFLFLYNRILRFVTRGRYSIESSDLRAPRWTQSLADVSNPIIGVPPVKN